MARFAERPALGQRARHRVVDPSTGRSTYRLLPGFSTLSYGEVWERAGAIAAAWRASGTRPVEPGGFVAVHSFTNPESVLVDLACIRLGAVCVPLQSSAREPQLLSIIEETGPRVLATSVEFLDRAVELVVSSRCAPRLVVLDHHPEADDERESLARARARLAAAGFERHEVEPLAATVERGRGLPSAPVFEPAPGDDPMRLLIYTSGSTGSPKGAIYTEAMLRGFWAGDAPAPGVPPVGINYMPLSHMAGRLSYIGVLRWGGTSCFTARSDLSTLLDDLALVRPTELLLVPRVSEMLSERYESESARREAEFTDRGALDAAVKAELRENVLGGRVGKMVNSTAPLSASLKDFMESCLGIPMHDVYASTEAGGFVLYDRQVSRPPVTDYKLVDVPELGYYTTDLPHPRGELLIKADSLTPGYFKQPELTASSFDDEGFYRTGDIMAETAPDRLVYLERRNSVLKLSQGEFVALSRLEAVFAACAGVRQVFLHGNSRRSYLLGVVVPAEEAIRRSESPESLKDSIMRELRTVARAARLEPHETPRDVLIETEPFTVEDGLLSDTRKNLRSRLRERYADRLERLYDKHDSDREDHLRALRDAGPGQPVLRLVHQAAHALLGCSPADLTPTTRFTDLGVDSLSAISYSAFLRSVTHVEVPVSVILDPTKDLRAVSRHIEEQRAPGRRSRSSSAVHRAASREVRADELTLEKFIEPESIAAAKDLPRPATSSPRVVLLTGANGYLGRFMCLDQLERLSRQGGRLVCLVRGRDATEARGRLDAAFDSGDDELRQRYRRAAEDRLTVLAGDIGKERLGLDAPTWARLARNVESIVHAGAHVNHVLPYEQLFGSNVMGTAEVIRLAVTGAIKPLTYLSTAAVAFGADPARLREAADIRDAVPTRVLSDAYGAGYTAGKWAGEVLLHEAHEACGLPVTVFRSTLLLAHTRYTGQVNATDVLTRLLSSVAVTRLAPDSFYSPTASGRGTQPHYDGLPVDFAAEAVGALGSRNTTSHLTYNMVNPHDDGISLDTFVDWVVEAGLPIRRIGDYRDWHRRMTASLKALPEDERRRSAFPVLRAFQEPGAPVAGSVLPASRFREAVHEAGLGRAGRIPHLSAGTIAKYCSDMRRLGLLRQ